MEYLPKGMLQEEALEKWNKDPTKCFLKDGHYLCHLLSKKEVHDSIMLDRLGACNWNEVFPWWKPFKLAVDIEQKLITDDTKGRAQEEELSCITRDIKAKHYVDYNEELEEPIILEATRLPDVFSIHLVYPTTWFATPGDVGRFLHPIIQKYPTGRMDLNIYSDHAIKQLRLPYCSKLDDPSRVLLPRNGPRRFDWDFFLKCCISTTICGPPPPGVTPKTCGTPIPKTISSRAQGEEGAKGEEEGVHRVLSYLRTCYGPFVHSGLVVKSGGREFECHVKPGLFCPLKYEKDKSGFHMSNGMYLGSKDGKRVYTSCTDESCRKHAYLAENFEALLSNDHTLL